MNRLESLRALRAMHKPTVVPFACTVEPVSTGLAIAQLADVIIALCYKLPGEIDVGDLIEQAEQVRELYGNEL